MDKREQIIEIASEIKICRNRLQELELKLDRLIGEAPRPRAAYTGSSANSNGRRSYGREILPIVDSEPTRVFSEDDLMKAAQIAEEKKASFRSALSRLVKAKSIARPKQKHYRSILHPEELTSQDVVNEKESS